MSDLTSLANVKGYLGITNGSEDSFLSMLIKRESDGILSWLNRSFDSVAYDEYYDGTGGSTLVMSNYPITAVESVTINNYSVPELTQGAWAGYVNDKTRITLRGFVFTRGTMNVRVQYTAGMGEVPNAVEQACIELVALTFRERDRVGLTSKGLAGEQTNFLTKAWPESVTQILNQYRKVTPT